MSADITMDLGINPHTVKSAVGKEISNDELFNKTAELITEYAVDANKQMAKNAAKLFLSTKQKEVIGESGIVNKKAFDNIKNRTHTVTIHNWANKTQEQRAGVMELETEEWLRANQDYEYADYTVMNGKYGAKVISFLFKPKSNV